MSDDPRAEIRKRGYHPITQEAERVKLGLFPSDDELPFAQAVRHRDELLEAVAQKAKR